MNLLKEIGIKLEGIIREYEGFFKHQSLFTFVDEKTIFGIYNSLIHSRESLKKLKEDYKNFANSYF